MCTGEFKQQLISYQLVVSPVQWWHKTDFFCAFRTTFYLSDDPCFIKWSISVDQYHMSFITAMFLLVRYELEEIVLACSFHGKNFEYSRESRSYWRLFSFSPSTGGCWQSVCLFHKLMKHIGANENFSTLSTTFFEKILVGDTEKSCNRTHWKYCKWN